MSMLSWCPLPALALADLLDNVMRVLQAHLCFTHLTASPSYCYTARSYLVICMSLLSCFVYSLPNTSRPSIPWLFYMDSVQFPCTSPKRFASITFIFLNSKLSRIQWRRHPPYPPHCYYQSPFNKQTFIIGQTKKASRGIRASSVFKFGAKFLCQWHAHPAIVIPRFYGTLHSLNITPPTSEFNYYCSLKIAFR